MREDTYGPMLLELFNSATAPITIIDAAERVGCSKQRAYTWVEKNRHKLVGITKARHGGMTYMGRENPSLKDARPERRNGGGTGDLSIGSILTVSDLVLSGGQIVLTLALSNGEHVTATLMR
jgi:hypothetical protein